ncbi:hypothetical protein ACLOJK_004324, partial [Asimina triloba]
IIQVHCQSTDCGAPSSSTGHRPTHLRRVSDRLIGAVQKIGHEETMGVGEHRRRGVTLQAASQAIPIKNQPWQPTLSIVQSRRRNANQHRLQTRPRSEILAARSTANHKGAWPNRAGDAAIVRSQRAASSRPKSNMTSAAAPSISSGRSGQRLHGQLPGCPFAIRSASKQIRRPIQAQRPPAPDVPWQPNPFRPNSGPPISRTAR